FGGLINVGGKVITSFGGQAFGLAIQTDGNIVVAGFSVTSGSQDFALARYNPDGTLDKSFGTGGKVTTDFSLSADEARALAIPADGRIVAAGRSCASAIICHFALARYNSDGTLDTSVG